MKIKVLKRQFAMEGKRKILATCDKMTMKKVANENF